MSGIYSLVPPLVAVIGAMLTKRVVPSLTMGLLAGTFIRAQGFVGGLQGAAQLMVDIVSADESTYILLFLFLFGALTQLLTLGGGISGFKEVLSKKVKDERGAFLSVFTVTPFSFLDCSFHVIATATITKPLVERVQGSMEKLAIIINFTSSQLVVLIPIATTYVGYVVGLLADSMDKVNIPGSAYGLYLKSVLLNFYSLVTVIFAIILIYHEPSFVRKLRAKILKSKKNEPKVVGHATHGTHEAREESEFRETVSPRLYNLVVPIGVLIFTLFYYLWLTGKAPGLTFWGAIQNADFNKALLTSTFSTLIFTSVFFLFQGVTLAELESHFLSGGAELLPPVVVLVLAWSIASVTRDLGFESLVSSVLGSRIPAPLLPAAIFVISGTVSYFIGSSWATWALIMPVGMSLSIAGGGVSLPLVIGATLAGGSIGDSVSPLGETPVLTATITGIPIVKHIKYVLPYGLLAAFVSSLAYLVIGFVWR